MLHGSVLPDYEAGLWTDRLSTGGMEMEKQHNRCSPLEEGNQTGPMRYVPPEMLERLFQSVKHGKVPNQGKSQASLKQV